MDNIEARSMKMTRIYNASPELIWEIITSPDYVKEWWGPEGFKNTIQEMDVREGGRWRFIMHGPDGTDYENDYIYQTVLPFKKIVLDHQKEPKFKIMIEIHEENGQTIVDWTNIFDSVPSKEEAIRAVKADVGLEQTLNHLGNFLQTNF